MVYMRVVLDAGHGGWDPGAVNKELGLKESDMTLDMAQEISRQLKAAGHEVYNIRQTYTDTPVNRNKNADLKARSNFANKIQANIFVSIHFNSTATGDGSARGFEILSSNGTGFKSMMGERLGMQIVKSIRAAFPDMKIRKEADSYVKKRGAHVLIKTKMPAVLLECGFIDNNLDAKFFLDENNRKAFASAVCGGIEVYGRAIG